MKKQSENESATEKPAAGFPWKKALFALLILIAIGGGLFTVAVVYFALSPDAGVGQCVAVIRVNGEITVDSQDGGIFGGAQTASSERLVKLLRRAADNDKYTAVLLDINSPGGSAVASKEIFEEVLKASEKKPVVSYLGEVAASGGYYIASASDEIVSDPNAITGSIGARMTLLNYAGLLEKLGISEEDIKSGSMKDIGSASRDMTAEERELLQQIINETAEGFVSDVRYARGDRIIEPQFSQVLDARVLSPKMALSAGLVDRIGLKSEALDEAYALSHEGNYTADEVAVCDLSKQGAFGSLLEESAQAVGRGIGTSIATQIIGRADAAAPAAQYR